MKKTKDLNEIIQNYLPQEEEIVKFEYKNYDKVIELFEEFFDKKSKYKIFSGSKENNDCALEWLERGKYKKPTIAEAQYGDIKSISLEFDGFISEVSVNKRISPLNDKANKSIDEVASYSRDEKEIFYIKNNDSDYALSNAYIIIKK